MKLWTTILIFKRPEHDYQDIEHGLIFAEDEEGALLRTIELVKEAGRDYRDCLLVHRQVEEKNVDYLKRGIARYGL